VHAHQRDYSTVEGWPLPTVETEANGDSRSPYERGPYLVGSLGSSAVTRELYSGRSALVGPVQHIFFPHSTLFQFFCQNHLAIWAGSRDGSPVS
jgi:hypothetical protein